MALKAKLDTTRVVYEVVAGLALTKGLEQLFVLNDQFSLPCLSQTLLASAYFLYVIRFIFWSRETLERLNDVTKSSLRMAMTAGILWLQAASFFVAALNIESAHELLLAVAAVIVLDIIWVVTASDGFSIIEKQKWYLHNAFAFVTTLVLAFLIPTPLIAWGFLIASICAATIDFAWPCIRRWSTSFL